MSRAAFAVLLLLAAPAFGQRAGRGYPPDLPDAKQEVYRTVGDVKLKLHEFFPEGHRPTDRRPAVVFFFGGGWTNGSPAQFATQAKYLAGRGMVAICADYRVQSRHGVTPVECVQDAKAAVAFVRANADRLGVDPDRIAAAGGSAGGHLAACTGIIEGFDSPDSKASSRANALVLFNPAVQLARLDDSEKIGAEVISRIDGRTGGRSKEISPSHHVGENEPPTLILHGVADTTVPFSTVQKFGRLMREEGNRCEVVGFKDQRHGFFNVRGGDDVNQRVTTRLMDEFFASLGWLAGKPTVAATLEEGTLVREGFEEAVKRGE